MKSSFIPDEGQVHVVHGRSIRMHMLARTKPSVRLTDEKLRALAQHSETYFHAVRDDHFELSGYPRVWTGSDFPGLDDISATKRISRHVFERFVSKGTFVLGSLLGYRAVENPAARDKREGMALLCAEVWSSDAYAFVTSGMNFGIFCASGDDANLGVVAGNFGEIELRIPSLRRFASAVAKDVGAQSFRISRVVYDDLKIFRAPRLPDAIGDLGLFGTNVTAEQQLWLHQQALAPSLFLKPTKFAAEAEVRVVFEFDRDLPRPRVWRNKSLLDLIEINS